MTKVLFLCFFYSVIFPAGYYLAAISLFVTYLVDKYMLLVSKRGSGTKITVLVYNVMCCQEIMGPNAKRW